MNQQTIRYSPAATDQGAQPDPPFSSAQRLAPIVAIVTTWVLGVYVALVLESPYWNDDIVDENFRSTLRASHTGLITYIWNQTSAFVHVDARFDPGTLAWTYSVFDVFDNRASYKLVVAALLVLAIVMVGLCVAAAASSWVPAAALVLIVSGLLQVRLWADGITSFGGLMALTIALTLGALWLLVAKPGLGWVILAGLMYMGALLTYEYAFALAPMMIVIIVVLRSDWRPAVAVLVPALLTLLISASLHLFVHAHPVAEYTISLRPGAILSTFTKQALAALPLSQWWLGSYPGLPPIAGTLICVCAILLGVPVFWALYRLGEFAPSRSGRAARLCGLLGISMWIAPAGLVALTKRWQDSMPWGEGYIPVVYEYFGLALCVLSLWMLISERLLARQQMRELQMWRLGSATVVALLSTFTMAANLSLMP